MPSVELLTECIAQPTLFARCDNRCGNFFSMPWEPQADAVANIRCFLESAKEKGWNIGLLGNMCAAHSKKAREEELRIVVPPSGLVH